MLREDATSSVINQKCESQKGGDKKTKHAKFSEKNEHFLPALLPTTYDMLKKEHQQNFCDNLCFNIASEYTILVLLVSLLRVALRVVVVSLQSLNQTTCLIFKHLFKMEAKSV